MGTRRQRIFPLLLLLIATVCAASGYDWHLAVPERARTRNNPLASDPQAAAAGAKLFARHCAQCHGDDATGRPGRPNLHSMRVRASTPGELEWLLTNGSLRNGMPSWSRLPEPQRWQLVTYLKSLQ
ncbi:MAG TPA: cytochrome c [Terriglobales bacterium]|jgi:mono/diheme cytochrome c family protein|nr:cytochrome c [Terriglobales bacterium]